MVLRINPTLPSTTYIHVPPPCDCDGLSLHRDQDGEEHRVDARLELEGYSHIDHRHIVIERLARVLLVVDVELDLVNRASLLSL